MATISTTAKPPVPEAPLHMLIEMQPHRIDIDLFPSTLISTDDETLSPEEVLADLEEDYGLSSVHGMLQFLYDQSWLEREEGRWNITLELTTRVTEEE